MEPSSRQPVIKFIESTTAAAPSAGEPEFDRPRALTTLVGVGAVCVALLLMGVAVSGRDEHEPDPLPASTSVAQRPTPRTPSTSTIAPSPKPELVEFIPWPNPPEDHDPTVIIHTGSGQPVFGDVTETSLVYVNSIGRPTIIALDTSQVEEVDVASSRTYDYFGVEFGHIVSFDGSRNIREATERALLFHAHRAGDDELDADYRASSRLSLHLCLTIEPCSMPDQNFDGITDAVDTIRRANNIDDPQVMEMMFGESWTTDRTSRLSLVGLGITQHIPAPLNDEVWIVHQPVVD